MLPDETERREPCVLCTMTSRYELIRACRQLYHPLKRRSKVAASEPYSQQRLSIVVAGVSERLAHVHVAGMTTNLIPLLEVSGAFVQGCLDAGRGVLAMARAREYGGIVAAERSAWELWNELDYLLHQPDPPTEAVKVQVNALFELTSWLKRQKDTSPEMLARNEKGCSASSVSIPTLFAWLRNSDKKGNSTGLERADQRS